MYGVCGWLIYIDDVAAAKYMYCACRRNVHHPLLNQRVDAYGHRSGLIESKLTDESIHSS